MQRVLHSKAGGVGVSALQLPRGRAYIWASRNAGSAMPFHRSVGFNSLAAAILVALAFLGPAAVPIEAWAQERRVPTSPNEIRLSYAPVVQRAAPGVVNVYAAKMVTVRNPLFDDPIFRRFFGIPGGGGEQVQRSLGSGVLVDPAGLVVTNHHVIEGADQVKISLSDKREFEAEIVLKDARSDLAVLRIKSHNERFAALEFSDSDALQVGDIVLAIGNPFAVGQTVTHGIVSAVARTQVGITDYQFFIQTDAAINPGNSGGALVDLTGRLVGINTAIFSRSGGSQGIGFAIPANMVKVVVASAKSGGSIVKRPWLGARLQAVTPEIAESLGLKRPAGALIASVSLTSPAGRAGLKTSDLVISMDGQTIEDPNAFDYRFATKPIGGSTRLGVMRAGRELVVNVTLEAAPDTPHEELVIASPSPFQGARISNLSPALADDLRLDPGTDGVVIVDIANGSPAQSLGFQRGDLVLSVNNAKIAKTRDLERIANQQNRLWRITIMRGGQQMSVELRG
jgi:Do/DeqQ family serine protease